MNTDSNRLVAENKTDTLKSYIELQKSYEDSFINKNYTYLIVYC